MNLIKTSFYSSISTILRILSAFIVNKMIALYIGPAGLAVMGNFQNFINILTGLSTSSINNGVVKYTAEYSNDPIRLKSLFSSSLRIISISSLVVGIGCVCLSSYFSNKIMHTPGYAYLFIIFGITVILVAINTILLCILNGKREITKFTLANVSSSILSLLITVGLIYYKQLTGALLSLVVAQTCFFFVSFYFLAKCNWFSVSMLFGKPDILVMKQLFRFSAMGITSAIVGPLALLLIRNFITRQVSVEGAGYWEAINRISSIYLMVLTSALAIYYLPRLSETHNSREVRNEILSGYKLILPVVIVVATVIYLFRFLIIHILFTHQFGPMESLFLFQLLGDILKIASWLLAFLMLAKAMARMYILTEIIFSLIYVLLSFLFIRLYGLVGVTYAYFTNYVLYLITCYFLLRKKMGL